VNPQNSFAQTAVKFKLNEMENAANLVGYINALNAALADHKKARYIG
jgi:hypothetical protein